MTLPVAYRRRVQHDLAAAYDWYEEQRSGFGEEFLSAVQSAFQGVGAYPDMFAPVHGDVRRAIIARFSLHDDPSLPGVNRMSVVVLAHSLFARSAPRRLDVRLFPSGLMAAPAWNRLPNFTGSGQGGDKKYGS